MATIYIKHNGKMPFTAQYVIDHYLKVGINTDCLYSVSVDNNTSTFTELVKS
ncbi:MAG: hypothetical protein J1E36_03260 [Eubacterium sp.]|nr:hypothetical protein [Eubacterium sp.]